MVIRPPIVADAYSWWAGEDDDQWHWLWNGASHDTFPRASMFEGVTEFIASLEKEWQAGDSARRMFGVHERASDTLVGFIELRICEDKRANLSWGVYPPYRRRGYARHASALANEYARTHMPVKAVVGIIDEESMAARRMAEAAGFVLDGPAERWEYGDETDGHMLRYVLPLR